MKMMEKLSSTWNRILQLGCKIKETSNECFWSEQSRFDGLFLPGQDNAKERDFKQFVLLSMLSYGVLNMVAAQSRGIPSRREVRP